MKIDVLVVVEVPGDSPEMDAIQEPSGGVGMVGDRPGIIGGHEINRDINEFIILFAVFRPFSGRGSYR